LLNFVTLPALASGHLYCLYSIIAPVLAFSIKFAILEEEPAYGPSSVSPVYIF
jgi:hypothetical protein